MQMQMLATTQLSLQPQLMWLFYSNKTSSFIVGDERRAFALPTSNPAAALPLQPSRVIDPNAPLSHPVNLPIPAELFEEFQTQLWHGFRLLDDSAYARAVDDAGRPVGDLLRTLVFGPNYGLYVEHPATRMILSLRDGSMELLTRSNDGFKSIDKTRTRGRAALAFCAHPNEPLIAYGDNYGTFHAHRFTETGFAKSSKIAAKERNASRVEFVNGGNTLALGGMGYLATYSYIGGKFAPMHEVSIAVHDFLWLDDGAILLVNGGLHGVSAYRYDRAGFTKLGAVKPEGAAQQIAISSCRRYLAATMQESPQVPVYQISQA
jgi:hypothetical protein